MITERIGMIVVDGLFTMVRQDFDARSMVKRQTELGRIAAHLKYISHSLRIPVVVTNFLWIPHHPLLPSFGSSLSSSLFSLPHEAGGNGGQSPEAAMGLRWAHCVTSQILLQPHPSNSSDPSLRQLIVSKSPLCGRSAFAVRISERGFEEVDESFLLSSSSLS